MGAARAPAAAGTAVVLAVLAVLVLVTWTASIGPGAVLTNDGPAATRAPVTPTPTDTGPGSAGTAPEPSGPRFSAVRPVLDLLLVLVPGVLLALGLVAAVRLGLGDRPEPIVLALARRRRRRAPTEPPDPPFPVLDAPDVLRHAVERGAAAQRAALLAGTPRNAVVGCWHRFEQQAAQAGLARHPAETSSEFILRALDLVQVDSGAVLRFAALYREARFSDHPLGEVQRAEAVAILDEIHAGLGTAPAGPRAPTDPRDAP